MQREGSALIRAFVIGAALLCAPPALAQDTPPAEASAPSPEAVAAARDFYTAMVFDGGALDALGPVFARYLAPQMRSTIVSSPIYRNARPDQRERLDAFVATMPDILINEFGAEMRRATDRVAPQFARIMTIDELTGATAFLQSPDMDPLWAQLMDDVGRTDGNSAQGTLPDWSGTAEGRAFAETPAGLALVRVEPQIDAILDAEGPAIFAALTPRIELIMLTGLCDALREDCPAHVRNALGRT